MEEEGVRLDGPWRAAPVDEALRRTFSDSTFDDAGWEPVPVPGHWRSVAAFADEDTGVLYRTTFDAPPPAGDDERVWLTFDGAFYQSDVWLDGAYLGDTEGYFFPHTFEVTDALRQQAEHVLAVDLTCKTPGDRTAKTAITGVFQHWDCIDPDWNPGGLWRPVHLDRTGPVRISRLRVLCLEATSERARLSVRAVLDAAAATTVSLRTTVAGTEHVEEQPLAAGENRVQWNVVVDRPRLWWPHALGDQPLEDVVVDVTPEGGAAPSDRRRVRTGLRQVRMKRWIVTVNGERLFLKGSNIGPTRMALGEATADELERDVSLARDAGLDMLRVHGHISRTELYDAADRHGMLLWQDMPLQWGYARGLRKQAARQAREAVDLLGHHPSIAVWCGHNEPLALDVEPGTADASPGRRAFRFAALQELPTWNKTLLDSTVHRALERADESRPVIAHSGVLPHPGSGGTDSHLYFGWYHGDERDLPRFLAAVPRMARFVTEFGAQAVPTSAAFVEPERWPDLDWDRLGRTHGLQRAGFDRYVPPADHATFDSWQRATQAYQATVVRHHVETLRRLKYRPTGGFAQFLFADAHPAVSWSVLDHERVPKAGYEALAAACAPVIVVADRPDASYRPGASIALDVHVVSDLRTPLSGAVVRARLAWTGGSYEWRWEGDVPADECVRVGTIQAMAPDIPGPLIVDLELDGDGVKAANRYESLITA